MLLFETKKKHFLKWDYEAKKSFLMLHITEEFVWKENSGWRVICKKQPGLVY